MIKRAVGLLVAMTLAVTLAQISGTVIVRPAVAAPPKAPPTSSTQARADKARAALDRQLAASGPRASATARAAALARTRAGLAAKKAAQAQLTALAAARASAAAAARARIAATARAKAKKSSPAVRKTLARAAAGTSAAARTAKATAARAAARARVTATAAARAGADATAKAAAARRARLDYVALSGPRVGWSARVAAGSRTRAHGAARTAAAARTRAAAALGVARTARLRARSAAIAAERAKATDTAAHAKSAKAPQRVKKATRAAAKRAARAARLAGARARTAGRTAAALHARARSATRAAQHASALARAAARAAIRAKKALGPNAAWQPRDRVVFNNPRGSKKQQLAIIREINAAIDATPAGGEIRMAQYLFNINSVATKLIKAHRRGASVQILVDDGEQRRAIRKVRKALGTNKRARSFVATCNHSCMSNGASTIHAKFYLFSVAGRARYVSMVSSANPYTGNTFNSWNNSHTIVGNATIYDSLAQYFTDMLADRNNPNYFRVTQSGKYTVYLYPQASRRPQDVVLLNVLNHTSCRTTAKGYGSRGRTVIRVANWGWTSSRMDIAKRLWQLHDQGCQVQVMINKGRISRPVVKQLLRRSKTHGLMPVYDAWYDGNLNDVAGLYLHHKMLTVNGLLDGRNVKITWTGSQNFTRLAASANNDIILRVVDPAVTDAYNRNFGYIRARHTHRMTKVPARTGRLNLGVADRAG